MSCPLPHCSCTVPVYLLHLALLIIVNWTTLPPWECFVEIRLLNSLTIPTRPPGEIDVLRRQRPVENMYISGLGVTAKVTNERNVKDVDFFWPSVDIICCKFKQDLAPVLPCHDRMQGALQSVIVET